MGKKLFLAVSTPLPDCVWYLFLPSDPGCSAGGWRVVVLLVLMFGLVVVFGVNCVGMGTTCTNGELQRHSTPSIVL
ncbi:hypothetical protein BKA65DRAFT_517000 [Rhexocercosporidium sp. MPI-PUGE-AT-0058]|nr:hypothetical protein BKA65DRAFT_517000 [Rhexocercosporidium sp. MPI-PUGE-AT-0058]